MTTEIKTFIGLEDVNAIQYECQGCHAKITIPLKSGHVPARCSNCKEDWFDNENDQNFKNLKDFAACIVQTRKKMAEYPNSGIRSA